MVGRRRTAGELWNNEQKMAHAQALRDRQAKHHRGVHLGKGRLLSTSELGGKMCYVAQGEWWEALTSKGFPKQRANRVALVPQRLVLAPPFTHTRHL